MKRAIAAFGWLAAQLLASAPPPKLLREINLNQIIRERPGLLPSTHSVRDLVFSPDEKWIAIGVGRHRREGKLKPGDFPYESHLLILPLQGPSDPAVQVDPGALLFQGSLAWSPNSDAVLVDELAGFKRGIAKLYSIGGEQLWERDGPGAGPLERGPVGGIFGFVDPGHLLARHMADKGKVTAFDALDLQGRVIDTWPVQKQWGVAAISPDCHLLAVFSDPNQSKTLIVDYPSKRVIQSKSNPRWLYENGGLSEGSRVYFAEAGKTVCSVGNAGNHAGNAECWDVASGEKIAEFQRFQGGAPAAASAHASRLVLTQVTPFPSKRRGEILADGERVVWDFRAGAEVSDWEVRGQSAETNSIIQPAPVAISPSGRSLAEGADGVLRIYELP